MKVQTAALVLLLVSGLGATTVASAGATGSAADPSRLVLARADFPSTATYSWGRMPASFAGGLAALGVKAKGAFYAAQFPKGSPRYQSVQGMVVTTGSAAQARTAYSTFKTQMRRGSMSVLNFPAQGDEQIALFQSPRLGSKVQLLVRRNRVVWQLEVAGEGLLVLSKAKLVAELEKYAAKQKRRVGVG